MNIVSEDGSKSCRQLKFVRDHPIAYLSKHLMEFETHVPAAISEYPVSEKTTVSL